MSLVFAAQISPWLYPSADAIQYLSVARSLAAEHRLSYQGDSALPVLPGYPVLLAPAFLLGNRPFVWVAVTHWAFATLAVLGIYNWVRRHCSQAALLLCALAVLNGTFMYYYRRPMKEVAYIAALVWLINVLHWLMEPQTPWRSAFLSLAAVALFALAGSIRAAAALLVVAFGLAMFWQAWRGTVRWRRAMVLTAAVAAPLCVAALMYLWHAGTKGPQPYIQSVCHAFTNPDLQPRPYRTNTLAQSRKLNRYWEGTRLKLSEITRAAVPGMFKSNWRRGEGVTIEMALYVPVALLFAWGWWRLLRRRLDLLAMMFPLWLLVYLPLAFDQGTRLVMAFLPLFTMSFWYAAEPLGARRQVVFAALMLIHLGLGLGYWLGIDAPRAYRLSQEWTAMEELASAIPPGREPVAMEKRDRSYMYLEFLLDRTVHPFKNVQRPGIPQPAPTWYVFHNDRDPPAPFVRRAEVGRYVVTRRPPAESPPQSTVDRRTGFRSTNGLRQ